MKYLKLIGLVAALATALTALLGVGSASATVLCKATESPCSAANKVTIGNVFDITLKAGTSALFQTTEGITIDTCTESTIKGELTTSGGSASTVTAKGSAANVVWGKCTSPMNTITAGETEIHYIPGTDNGTVTARGFETTIFVQSLGLSCVYSYASGIDVGLITGGSPAKLDINAVVPRSPGSSVFCPADARVQAEATFTEPTPLYVVSG